jgi:adenylate cyclase
LAVKHGLDKIKTIGDCYMAVSGLSHNTEGQVVRAADFALELLSSFDELKEEDGYTMDLRVGMHTGPVIAGVIGLHRFAYDLWGDTVNIASRMESQGLPGRIQISDAVRCQLGDRYACEQRGEIEVRGWGPMKTWWLASPSS